MCPSTRSLAARPHSWHPGPLPAEMLSHNQRHSRTAGKWLCMPEQLKQGLTWVCAGSIRAFTSIKTNLEADGHSVRPVCRLLCQCSAGSLCLGIRVWDAAVHDLESHLHTLNCRSHLSAKRGLVWHLSHHTLILPTPKAALRRRSMACHLWHCDTKCMIRGCHFAAALAWAGVYRQRLAPHVPGCTCGRRRKHTTRVQAHHVVVAAMHLHDAWSLTRWRPPHITQGARVHTCCTSV